MTGDEERGDEERPVQWWVWGGETENEHPQLRILTIRLCSDEGEPHPKQLAVITLFVFNDFDFNKSPSFGEIPVFS